MDIEINSITNTTGEEIIQPLLRRETLNFICQVGY